MKFFTNKGYTAESTEYDLIADLAAVDVPTSSEQAFSAPGYRFSLCSTALRPAAIEFLSHAFPGRWHREICAAFDAGMEDVDLALALRTSDNLL